MEKEFGGKSERETKTESTEASESPKVYTKEEFGQEILKFRLYLLHIASRHLNREDHTKKTCRRFCPGSFC